jgi:hypothetical protein
VPSTAHIGDVGSRLKPVLRLSPGVPRTRVCGVTGDVGPSLPGLQSWAIISPWHGADIGRLSSSSLRVEYVVMRPGWEVFLIPSPSIPEIRASQGQIFISLSVQQSGVLVSRGAVRRPLQRW